MTEKDLKYLSDVLQAIELIESFTESITEFEEYDRDLKTQSAVERQLSIIGEAVNKYDFLNPDLSLENARKIVGFRNRLIHAYDAIDSSIVWAIIKNHLDPLKIEIKHLIG
jgi:uncharacterized protein with HEPN domain